MGCIEGRGQTAVCVIRHRDNSDDPAWGTLARLQPGLQNPGCEQLQEAVARGVLRGASEMGTVYVNPKYTVLSPPGTGMSQFIRAARAAQASWLKQLRTVLGSSRHVKRAMKRTLPLLRQLGFTGLLVIDGRHVHPQLWPDRLGKMR